MGGESERSKLFNHGHRVVKQREVIPEIEAGAHVLARIAFQDRDDLIKGPILMILEGERNFLLLANRNRCFLWQLCFE